MSTLCSSDVCNTKYVNVYKQKLETQFIEYFYIHEYSNKIYIRIKIDKNIIIKVKYVFFLK